MKKHLNILNTVAEYQEYSASTAYSKPNVTYVRENKVLYYDYGNNKPQADMSSYKGEFQDISVGGNYYGKTAITKINYIPTGLTSLSSAFYSYSSLEEVTCEIPSGVTGMSQTFDGCKNLVNAPVIPNSVTNMSYTFQGCRSLVNAPVIPNSVTDMNTTFSNCSSLVNVPNISSGVTNMNTTFSGCYSLVTVPNIPSGVINMNYTFTNCSNLKELTLLPTTPPSYSNTVNACPKLETIYVPDEAVDAYKTATGWSQFADKIKPLSSKPSE